MQENNHFVDLRIGHGAQGVGDESVWPSFTDIMTVIVMIFLMALVVILIRKSELDRELISTISDREHAEMVSESLERSLSESVGERDRLRRELESELSRIALLNLENDELEDRISELGRLREELESSNADLNKSLLDTISQRDALRKQLESELEQIALLTEAQGNLEGRLEELGAVRADLISANTLLESEKQAAEQDILVLRQKEQDARSRIELLLDGEQSLKEQINKLAEKLSQLELESTREIDSLTRDKRSLGAKLDTISRQLAEVRRLFHETELLNRDLGEEISQLVEIRIAQEQQYDLAQEEIEGLKELIRVREAENRALRIQADTSAASFRSLQMEYEALDAEYRNLIRPARTEAGKQVADVHLDKSDTGLSYRLRKPGQSAVVPVSLDQLHAELANLKNQLGKMLYTKILISEGGLISYDEAWRFTQEILGAYDYYYQD